MLQKARKYLRIRVLERIFLEIFPSSGLSLLGSYDSYNEALRDCEGYSNSVVLEKVRLAIIEVLEGKKRYLKCSGLLSTCLQHEINHLDGKLIIDHLSKLKRDLIIKKISKSRKIPDRIIV